MAIYEHVAKAVERAREGNGPSIIEAKTYRFLGHGASDNRSYRTREEEEEEWKRRGPIVRFKRRLIRERVMREEETKMMQKQIRKEVEDATEHALKCPEPKAKDVEKYLYV